MQILVSPSWLAKQLSNSDLAIVDATLPPVGVTPRVDTHARYLEKHIPGAVFFDIDELSDHSTSLPHMLPTSESFASSMSQLGISNTMTIVIYEQEGVFSAPRAWWMLRTFGVQNVCVLDGGLRAWVEAGLPIEAGAVKRPQTAFAARRNSEAVKTFADIQRAIADHDQIVDARSAGRFAGTAPEPRPGISSGHMPGATSVPFTELLREGQLKPAAELRQYFVAKGVDLDRPVTTTCGSGVTAAVVQFGLELADAKHVSLYDGSWAEYAQRPEAVIATDSTTQQR